MNLIQSKTILFPKELDHIYIVPFSDMHVGNPAGYGGNNTEGEYATKQFDGWLKWLENTPEAYTILMGDLFETALKDSLGNVYSACHTLYEARELLREKLYPIRHKILGAFDGNHEERLIRAANISWVKELCGDLGVDYFPSWCAYFFLQVGESRDGKDKRRPYTYTLFAHHMTGGGRTAGGKLNKVAQLKQMVQAEIYCGAHVHTKSASVLRYMVPDYQHKKLIPTKETYCTTGSFMGYADYSIRGQYQKPETGAVRIRLSGNREKGKDVHISL